MDGLPWKASGLQMQTLAGWEGDHCTMVTADGKRESWCYGGRRHSSQDLLLQWQGRRRFQDEGKHAGFGHGRPGQKARITGRIATAFATQYAVKRLSQLEHGCGVLTAEKLEDPEKVGNSVRAEELVVCVRRRLGTPPKAPSKPANPYQPPR